MRLYSLLAALLAVALAPDGAWATGTEAPGEQLASLGLPRFVVKELDHPERRASKYEIVSMLVETFRLREAVDALDARQRQTAAGTARRGGPVNPAGALRTPLPEPYMDVPPHHWAAGAVDVWWRWGMGGEIFRGRHPVQRRRFAWMLGWTIEQLHRDFRVLPWHPEQRVSEPFRDVPGDEPQVEDLRRWGVVAGRPDGTFGCKDYLTRGELQACLERAAALFAAPGGIR